MLYDGYDYAPSLLQEGQRAESSLNISAYACEKPSLFELKGTKIAIAPKEINNGRIPLFSRNEVFHHFVTKSVNRSKERPKTSNGSRNSPAKRVNVEYMVPAEPIFLMHPWIHRIYFTKRERMSSRRLLIIQFDGVIGDFIAPNGYWPSEPPSLYLRPNAQSFLENLAKNFQIALVFRCTSTKADFAVQYLLKAGVKVDAAYVISQNPWYNLPTNYVQAYLDFGLLEREIGEKVIIIGSYDCDEISKELFEHKCVYKFHEVLSSVPIVLKGSAYKTIPVVILIRNTGLSTIAGKVPTLNLIEHILGRYDNWEASYWLLQSIPSCTTVETFEIQKEYIEHQCRIVTAHANRDMRQRKIIRRRQREEARKDAGQDEEDECNTDAQTNIKYVELLQCNEDISNQILDYYNSISADEPLSKACDIDQEVDTEAQVKHRLIVVKDQLKAMQKYQPVATLSKPATNKKGW